LTLSVYRVDQWEAPPGKHRFYKGLGAFEPKVIWGGIVLRQRFWGQGGRQYGIVDTYNSYFVSCNASTIRLQNVVFDKESDFLGPMALNMKALTTHVKPIKCHVLLHMRVHTYIYILFFYDSFIIHSCIQLGSWPTIPRQGRQSPDKIMSVT